VEHAVHVDLVVLPDVPDDPRSRDDGRLLPDEPVEQRGFAAIGTADEDDET